jgi:glucosamine--fructose-6-phosphate aminotransferase (isomerizing)
VHNGIIENYISLRRSLEELGRVFVSQTDTETAAHLIDYYYSETNNPLTAITLALGKIRGSYALAMMFSDIPDKIYAARCDNPLIIGVGKGENYIASDIPAILSHTRDYYLIEEQEIAELTREGVKIFGLGGRDITAEKQLMTANWDVEAAEKGGYPHFMLKEIHEQPRSLAAAILPRFENGLDGVLHEEIPDTAGIKRLVIVACGSAMHAGLLGESAIEKYARVPVEVRDSVEAYVACLSGAVLRDDYLAMMRDAGFTDVHVTAEQTFTADDLGGEEIVEEFQRHTGLGRDELLEAASRFQSVRVAARKPA